MEQDIGRQCGRGIRFAVIFFVAVILMFLVLDMLLPKPTAKSGQEGVAAERPWRQSPPEKGKDMKTEKRVLVSSLAERGWYTADANALKTQIQMFLSKADVSKKQDVVAMILPHAGYAYSGQTAAFGLNAATGPYERIVVIGPSHYVAMEDVLSVPRETHFQTPLGETPLDTEFTGKLLAHPVFQSVERANKLEHSVHIEVPLLQSRFGNFRLVPIVAGQCSPETIAEAARILKGLVDDKTLVVASSDFVHYGPNFDYVPFTEDVPARIKELDMGAYDRIAALDAAGFLQYRQKTGATICGYVPIAILLSMLGTDAKAELVQYKTSGEITGDYSSSVSYLSAVFTGKWGSRGEVADEAKSQVLSQEDKRILLTLARKTIVYFLEHRTAPTAEQFGLRVSDAMRVPRAAFVTLEKFGQLRGCIGDILPRQPLYKSVIANAINAAVNDMRFTPVTSSECNGIHIEISALTAPAPIASWEQIRISIDGVVMSKDGRSAIFLPQVAPEQGWDVNQMLTHLSMKAGLPADAWKSGAEFLVFQAEVFGEQQ